MCSPLSRCLFVCLLVCICCQDIGLVSGCPVKKRDVFSSMRLYGRLSAWVFFVCNCSQNIRIVSACPKKRVMFSAPCVCLSVCLLVAFFCLYLLSGCSDSERLSLHLCDCLFVWGFVCVQNYYFVIYVECENDRQIRILFYRPLPLNLWRHSRLDHPYHTVIPWREYGKMQ